MQNKCAKFDYFFRFVGVFIFISSLYLEFLCIFSGTNIAELPQYVKRKTKPIVVNRKCFLVNLKLYFCLVWQGRLVNGFKAKTNVKNYIM